MLSLSRVGSKSWWLLVLVLHVSLKCGSFSTKVEIKLLPVTSAKQTWPAMVAPAQWNSTWNGSILQETLSRRARGRHASRQNLMFLQKAVSVHRAVCCNQRLDFNSVICLANNRKCMNGNTRICKILIHWSFQYMLSGKVFKVLCCKGYYYIWTVYEDQPHTQLTMCM